VIEDARALDELVRIARAACAIVRVHYATKFDVEYKVGDDPVTAADRASNAFVCAELERAFPGVPIVAEENDPTTFDVRRDARECFFVDPLDGTREFVARNGEFAVMLGLARDGRAALGVVAAPETDRVFAGGPSVSSFEIARDGSQRALVRRANATVRDARAVVSRSRATPETFAALAKMGIVRVDKLGSAGLKVGAIAAGEADLWIQTGVSGMLWDACGPEAIALGAGVRYAEHDRAPPDYARGPLELAGLVVAANDALFDAAFAALRA
jgi:3'(2'), 5'-bisphosphate nucleotidase